MEKKDTFTEFKLEWFDKNVFEILERDRLTTLLRFIKNNNILHYTISGFNQNKEWKILIKIGK